MLDLTDPEVLAALDVGPDDLIDDDRSITQEIGEAAYGHGFQAILSPSATGVDDVIAVFSDSLAGATLRVERIERWAESPDLDPR